MPKPAHRVIQRHKITNTAKIIKIVEVLFFFKAASILSYSFPAEAEDIAKLPGVIREVSGTSAVRVYYILQLREEHHPCTERQAHLSHWGGNPVILSLEV